MHRDKDESKEERVKRNFRLTPVDVVLIIVALMIGISIAISNYNFQVGRDLIHSVKLVELHNKEITTTIDKNLQNHENSTEKFTNKVLNDISGKADRNFQTTVTGLNAARQAAERRGNSTILFLTAEILDLNEDINNLMKAQNITGEDVIINNGTHVFIRNDSHQKIIENPIKSNDLVDIIKAVNETVPKS